MNYKECILFGKSSCGDFKKYRAAIDGFFISEKLDKSVTAHFQELKVKVNPEEQNELTLIGNRLGTLLREGEKLLGEIITDLLMGLLGTDLKNSIIQIMHIPQIEKSTSKTNCSNSFAEKNL